MVDVTPADIIGGRVAKGLQDFVDLQNEISGRDVPRIPRFLSPDDDRTLAGRRKKENRARFRQTLQDLMRDREYARLYVELGDRLRDAERAAETALATIRRQLEAVQQDILDMTANAARDADGNPVFRYADGRAVYADGTEVPNDIAEGIVWPNDAPSAEAYFAALAQKQELQGRFRDWDVYRHDVLGGIRDRYDNDDPPMSKDDLKRDLERIESLNPGAVSLDQDSASLEGRAVTAAASIAVPTALK